MWISEKSPILQGHYLAHLASKEQKGGRASCMPVLYVEISCDRICVGGFAAIGRRVLSEPLMQPLQLYHSLRKSEAHAGACRTMAAIRLTLVRLAAEQQSRLH